MSKFTAGEATSRGLSNAVMYSLTRGAEAMVHERGLRGRARALRLRAASRVQAWCFVRRAQPEAFGEAPVARARGRRAAGGGAPGRLARRRSARARSRINLSYERGETVSQTLRAVGLDAERVARR